MTVVWLGRRRGPNQKKNRGPNPRGLPFSPSPAPLLRRPPPDAGRAGPLTAGPDGGAAGGGGGPAGGLPGGGAALRGPAQGLAGGPPLPPLVGRHYPGPCAPRRRTLWPGDVSKFKFYVMYDMIACKNE